MNDFIKKTKQFILEDVWNLRLKEHSRRKGFLIRQLRIILLALRGFNENRVQARASELTYYSILSIVPIMAMIIGVAKGFGFNQRVEAEIKKALEGQKEILNYVLDFTNNFIESVQGGVIAGIGLAFLVYTVMKMFSDIERSFNDIWQVKKGRSFSRKFSDYLSMMLIAPMLVVLASGSNVFIQSIASGMEKFQSLDYVVKLLIAAIPWVLIWILFTLVYIIMPNTKVRFRYAIVGGIIAGTMFQVLQWAYIEFQGAFSRYNTVYGTFAALPLFLIWLQLSWVILLFGAEVSFANQNIRNYEHEVDSLKITLRERISLTLLIAHLIIRRFADGEPALTATETAKQLELPTRLVKDIIYDLIESGILAEVSASEDKEMKYQPAMDIHKLSISFILKRLEEKGSKDYHPVSSEKLDEILRIQDDFMKAIEQHPDNKLLMNV
ncbi:MAG: YihY/virulence factor BrkB family protein [Bacteroidota bacterium]